jgi:hypothetical protein
MQSVSVLFVLCIIYSDEVRGSHPDPTVGGGIYEVDWLVFVPDYTR